MEAPGRVRSMAARAARPTSFLSCHRTSMWAPVGGTFWFQIFIQAPSLEIWRKTISGAEGGSGEEVGWPVFGLPPWKNIGWGDRAHLDASSSRCLEARRRHGRSGRAQQAARD